MISIGGIEMTTNVIRSYGKEHAKQLILMETSINKNRKVTNMKEKNGLRESRKQFRAEVIPLPKTFFAHSVYQQAKIHYVKLGKN